MSSSSNIIIIYLYYYNSQGSYNKMQFWSIFYTTKKFTAAAKQFKSKKMYMRETLSINHPHVLASHIIESASSHCDRRPGLCPAVCTSNAA